MMALNLPDTSTLEVSNVALIYSLFQLFVRYFSSSVDLLFVFKKILRGCLNEILH